MNFPENIKLLVLDVDGTLTDGGIYYDNEGHEFKKFNAKDGLGIVMAQESGIDIMLLTGHEKKTGEQNSAR